MEGMDGKESRRTADGAELQRGGGLCWLAWQRGEAGEESEPG